MWKYKTPGIPDEEFERAESVPITKEEVRTIQISKARLSTGQTVLDIVCECGTINVESGETSHRLNISEPAFPLYTA